MTDLEGENPVTEGMIGTEKRVGTERRVAIVAEEWEGERIATEEVEVTEDGQWMMTVVTFSLDLVVLLTTSSFCVYI